MLLKAESGGHEGLVLDLHPKVMISGINAMGEGFEAVDVFITG